MLKLRTTGQYLLSSHMSSWFSTGTALSSVFSRLYITTFQEAMSTVMCLDIFYGV